MTTDELKGVCDSTIKEVCAALLRAEKNLDLFKELLTPEDRAIIEETKGELKRMRIAAGE